MSDLIDAYIRQRRLVERLSLIAILNSSREGAGPTRSNGQAQEGGTSAPQGELLDVDCPE